MRDKSKSSGTFLYKLTTNEVLDHINDYDLFSVAESLYEANTNNLVVQGAIQITSDWILRAVLGNTKGQSNRQVENNPKYNLSLDLNYDRIPNICGLNKVIDYYAIHNLFGLVMEFGLYDIPVGINRENIIVWELRNY